MLPLLCLRSHCVPFGLSIFKVMDSMLEKESFLFCELLLYLNLVPQNSHCEPPSRLQGIQICSSLKRTQHRDKGCAVITEGCKSGPGQTCPGTSAMSEQLRQCDYSFGQILHNFGLFVST